MSYALDRDFDRMHTLDDFCALIGCRKTKAYDLIRDKKLRAIKVEGATRIYRSEIDRFLAEAAKPLVLGRRGAAPGSFGRE